MFRRISLEKTGLCSYSLRRTLLVHLVIRFSGNEYSRRI